MIPRKIILLKLGGKISYYIMVKSRKVRSEVIFQVLKHFLDGKPYAPRLIGFIDFELYIIWLAYPSFYKQLHFRPAEPHIFEIIAANLEPQIGNY